MPNFFSNYSQKLTIIASAAVLALVATTGLAFPPGRASAAELPPPAAIQMEPAAQFDNTVRLEIRLKRLQNILRGQQGRVDIGRDVVAAAQDWIDHQKAKGRDTAGLEAALATLIAELDVAQAKLNEAEQVLATKPGFDENGKVTDREQARHTLDEAGRVLRDAHLVLKKATIDFRRAVRDYRQAHRDSR